MMEEVALYKHHGAASDGALREEKIDAVAAFAFVSVARRKKGHHLRGGGGRGGADLRQNSTCPIINPIYEPRAEGSL